MKFTKKLFLRTLLITLPFLVISYNFLDRDIAEYFYAHKENFHHIGKLLSIAGESQWYIGAGVVGFLFFTYIRKNNRYKERFLFLLYANIFSGIVSLLLKWFFSRVRPKGLHHTPDEYGFLLFQHFDKGIWQQIKYHYITMLHFPSTYASFPSGHTVTIASTCTVLYLIAPRYRTLWILLGVVFASGRILSDKHFLSDVVAGGVVGVFATLFIYDKMSQKLKEIDDAKR